MLSIAGVRDVDWFCGMAAARGVSQVAPGIGMGCMRQTKPKPHQPPLRVINPVKGNTSLESGNTV